MSHRVALLLCTIAVACTAAERDDAPRHRGEVRAAVERYVAASRTVDPDSIASFFAANGVLFEPGIPPIQSAESIRIFMGSFPGVVVESASVVLDTIDTHGATAYVWGEYFERLAFPGQPRSEQRGRFVMHWVQEAGAWKIRRYYRIPLTTVVPAAPASASP